MRLFFGLGCPEQLKLQIDHWRDTTYKVLGPGVPAANFHVTLAYLGECPEAKLEPVLSAAGLIEEAQFKLCLDQLGYWNKPGLIWLGCSAAPESIFNLAKKCRAVATGQQHYRVKNSANKRYQPHMTLWRNQPELPPAPLVPPDFTLQCTDFSLFESIAVTHGNKGAAGVRYREVESWPLAPLLGR